MGMWDALKEKLAKQSAENEANFKASGDQMEDRVKMKLNPNLQGPELPSMTSQEQAQLEHMTPAVGSMKMVQEAAPLAQGANFAKIKNLLSGLDQTEAPVAAQMAKAPIRIPSAMKYPVSEAGLQEAKQAMATAKNANELQQATEQHGRLMTLLQGRQ